MLGPIVSIIGVEAGLLVAILSIILRVVLIDVPLVIVPLHNDKSTACCCGGYWF